MHKIAKRLLFSIHPRKGRGWALLRNALWLPVFIAIFGWPLEKRGEASTFTVNAVSRESICMDVNNSDPAGRAGVKVGQADQDYPYDNEFWRGYVWFELPYLRGLEPVQGVSLEWDCSIYSYDPDAVVFKIEYGPMDVDKNMWDLYDPGMKWSVSPFVSGASTKDYFWKETPNDCPNVGTAISHDISSSAVKTAIKNRSRSYIGFRFSAWFPRTATSSTYNTDQWRIDNGYDIVHFGGSDETWLATFSNIRLTVTYKAIVNYYVTGPLEVLSGETAQYKATGVYEDGTTVDLTSTGGWGWRGAIDSISSSGFLEADPVTVPSSGTVCFSDGVVRDVPDGSVEYPITVVPWTPVVSGRVTHRDTGAGVDGVTITFSNMGTATTSGGGYYSKEVSNGWSGTATPSYSSGTFAPPCCVYSNVTSNKSGENYTWNPEWNPVISGDVTVAGNSAGLDGVTITFSNDGGSTTTSGGGHYSKEVPYGWSGTATPSYSSGTFTPSSRSYSNVADDRSGQNYTWNPSPNPVISGRVTHRDTGAGVDGVTITFSNVGTATTSGGGYYSREVPYNWSGTATPSYSSGTFTPSSRSYSNVTSNKSGENYTWNPPGNPVISGRVTHRDTGAGIDGVTITFSNVGTATTSGGGYYSKEVPNGWSGTATPSYSSGTFTPSSRSYGNVTSNKSGENYTWNPPGNPVISGRVTHRDTGAGVDGVTITFSNVGTATTSGGGYYSREVPYNWSGTATPSYSSGTFTPSSRSYSNVTSNKSGENYTWNPGLSWDFAYDGNVNPHNLVTTSPDWEYGDSEDSAQSYDSIVTSAEAQAGNAILDRYDDNSASAARFYGLRFGTVACDSKWPSTRKATLVIRAKNLETNYVGDPNGDINKEGKALLDVRDGTSNRWTLAQTESNQWVLDCRNDRESGRTGLQPMLVSEANDWHIIRIVVTSDGTYTTYTVYYDEKTTPKQTVTRTETIAQLRFELSRSAGTNRQHWQIDWIRTKVGEAWSPSQGAQIPGQGVTPQITRIDPAVPPVDPNPRLVKVYGSGFVPGSKVIYGFGNTWYPPIPDAPPSLARSFYQNSGLIDTYPKLNRPGKWKVKVRNPDGAESNVLEFVVGLSIARIEPEAPPVDPNPRLVKVYGSGFVPGSKVIYGFGNTWYPPIPDAPPSLARSFYQNSGLIDTYPKLNRPGTWKVKVRNPDGAESNVLQFQVGGLAITRIDPAVPPLDPNPRLVKVYGAGFVAQSQVIYGFGNTWYPALPLARKVYQNSGLIDTYPKLNRPGTWKVKVRNPDGAESNVFQFQVAAARTSYSLYATEPTLETSIDPDTGDFVLLWDGVGLQPYIVEASDDLQQWYEVSDVIVPLADGPVSWRDADSVWFDRRFYRLLLFVD